MTIKPFDELTKQVHLLNDLILSDMVGGTGDYAEESLIFKRRLFTLKYWFDRISWANKRRYILALLEDLKSAWALSLLLKSLWNCRPKDAVQSASKPPFLTVYDRTPMDHNRTAIPPSTLGQVMTTDRKWFHTLEPEPQAQVLAELLNIAGGPIMWEVLRRGERIYNHLRDYQLQNLLQCVVVDGKHKHDEHEDNAATTPPAPAPTLTAGSSKLNMRQSRTDVSGTVNRLQQTQKELDTKLAQWNVIVRHLRESQKLEELEMTFVDGTKRKIWKVLRHQPESYETVDFLDLLPSYIAKKIFSYLPIDEFANYAKVNRYWAYVMEELKAEWAARSKMTTDMIALRENMLKHDISLDVLAAPVAPLAGSTLPSISPSYPRAGRLMSYRASEKSAGGVSFRHVVDKLKPPYKIKSKPIKKLSDLEDKLVLRGAADENMWSWCKNVIEYTQGRHPEKKPYEGVLQLGNMHFPCPLMKYSLVLPLPVCLTRDPMSTAGSTKHRSKLTYDDIYQGKLDHSRRRINLWSRNFSSLYKVLKVASYHTPLLQNKLVGK